MNIYKNSHMTYQGVSHSNDHLNVCGTCSLKIIILNGSVLLIDSLCNSCEHLKVKETSAWQTFLTEVEEQLDQ